MKFCDYLKPGRRQNAFYVQPDIEDKDHLGEQVFGSEKRVVVYEWDSQKKQNVRKIVEKSKFDTLR